MEGRVYTFVYLAASEFVLYQFDYTSEFVNLGGDFRFFGCIIRAKPFLGEYAVIQILISSAWWNKIKGSCDNVSFLRG